MRNSQEERRTGSLCFLPCLTNLISFYDRLVLTHNYSFPCIELFVHQIS